MVRPVFFILPVRRKIMLALRSEEPDPPVLRMFCSKTRGTRTVQGESVPLRSHRFLTGRCRATAALYKDAGSNPAGDAKSIAWG